MWIQAKTKDYDVPNDEAILSFMLLGWLEWQNIVNIRIENLKTMIW
jgi:hypothetical protein